MEDCPSTTSDRDFEKLVDDIITHSDTVEGAFQRICSILSHYNKIGLVFNAEKFRFARREVEFAEFMITEDGIKVHLFHQRLPFPMQHLGSESVVWVSEPGCSLFLQN